MEKPLESGMRRYEAVRRPEPRRKDGAHRHDKIVSKVYFAAQASLLSFLSKLFAVRYSCDKEIRSI